MLVDNFKRWNILVGWFSFAVALVTYFLTVEPTGSFWDAGEYITTSAKLQVGHPPGAPLLQMIGAFFSLFAFGDVTKIALMVNIVSVVSSAFAVLFTFWIITNLVQKMIGEKELNTGRAIAILGSGLVGALAFTFSDSFWFNAVETEVYAMASFIMALLLWLGLKWTDNLDEPRGDRWLLLICFVVGLVFGIQFMGFLAIPSIGLLYYFKKYNTINVVNFLVANFLVIIVLVLVYKFSLTYVLKIFGWGEVFFVNQLGLPFNSGTIIIGLLFIAAFYFGLSYTRKNNLYKANLITLCLMFLMLGFSSWLMLPIRANARTVVNENNPEDARSLLAYYNREQYPGVESPFYGSYFSNTFAPAGDDIDEKPKYEKDKKLGKYDIANKNYENALQGPNKKHVGLMPRMWSEQHAENYMRYFGRLEYKIKPEYIPKTEIREAIRRFEQLNAAGQIDTEQYIEFLRTFSDYIDVKPPTLMDNITYLLEFQWSYMYFRYFMWNFVGRQNDIQGRYDNNGKWLSGIKLVDSWFHGSQENLPSEVLDNKARNTYFFLPLILGLIGVLFQISRNPRHFWMLFVFFLFTGLAIQFYTNPYIFQPRERDYSLVGSFFIFCIWIGIGVYGLFDELRKLLSAKIAAPLVTSICLLAVPSVMAYQNWDDHDRSGRYTAQSTAKAYLSSCQEDAGAILFTIGDNDTFPLWYLQEIENYRRDVRVVNTSLFATDWYIDQMKRKAYESDPIPSQLTHEKYRYGTRDAIYYQGLTDNRWDIKDFMNWVGGDKPESKLRFILGRQGADLSQYSESNLDIIYYPTNKIRIPVNKQNVLESGLVKQKDSALIVDYIDIDLPKNALPKNRILMLDIMANNDWKRPIYFSGGSFENAEYIWMKEYLQMDGLVYKLVPIRTENANGFEMGRIDTDLAYGIVTNWEWGNSGDVDIYHDTQTRSQGLSFRSSLARLMEQLIEEGKIEMAKNVIDIAMTNMPFEQYGFYAFTEPFLEGYYKVGEVQKARALFEKFKKVYQERLRYYDAMSFDDQYNNIEEIISDLEAYQRVVFILSDNGDDAFSEKESEILKEYIGFFDDFVDSEQDSDAIENEIGYPTTIINDSIGQDSVQTLDSLTVQDDSVGVD